VVDRDELQRDLSLARAGLRAPSAAKLRVRAKLGADHAPASEAGSSAGSPSARDGQALARAQRWLTRRPHLTTVGVLMLSSFGAGYWLGRSPEASRSGDTAAVHAPLVSAAPAGADAAVGRHPAEPLAAPGRPPSSVSRDVMDPAASTSAVSSMPAASSALEAPASPAASPAAAGEEPAASAGASARPGERRPRAARRSSTSLGTADDRLAAELALLARTERAIRSGEAPLALALLGELDQRFPVPALREEREAARVLAGCVSSGGVAGAESSAPAERFIGAHPASVYADRIRESCGLAAVVKRAERIEEGGAAGH